MVGSYVHGFILATELVFLLLFLDLTESFVEVGHFGLAEVLVHADVVGTVLLEQDERRLLASRQLKFALLLYEWKAQQVDLEPFFDR